MKTDVEKRITAIAECYGIEEIDIAYVNGMGIADRYRVFAWVESPFDGSAFTVKATGGTASAALDVFESHLKDHLAMLGKWEKEQGG